MTGSNTSGASVASLTFSPRSGSDKVPVEITDELVRRSVVTIEDLDSGNVVFSPTAPSDKTKVWWKTNPVTGIPEGVAQIWSEAENAWVPSNNSAAPYVPPKQFITSLDLVAGDTARSATIPDMGRNDYFVDFEFSTGISPVDNSGASVLITGKTNVAVGISAYNIPAGGLRLGVRVTNPQ